MVTVSKFMNIWDQYYNCELENTEQLIDDWNGLNKRGQRTVYRKIESDRNYTLEEFEMAIVGEELDDDFEIIPASECKGKSLVELSQMTISPITELPILGVYGTNLMFMERRTMITAGPKSCKSKFILENLFEWCNLTDVVIFSEEPDAVWATRTQELISKGKQIPSNCTIYNNSKYNMRHIVYQAKHMKPGQILVVDTLRKFSDCVDENSSVAVHKAFNPLLDAAKDSRITLIALQHSGKAAAESGKKDAVNASAGSNALPGMFDATVQIIPTANTIKINGKNRDARCQSATIKWIDDLMVLSIDKSKSINADKSTIKETIPDNKPNRIYRILGEDWITAKDVTDLLNGECGIDSVLCNMAKAGIIEKELPGGSKGQRYRRPMNKPDNKECK